jgi:hypothetical protein
MIIAIVYFDLDSGILISGSTFGFSVAGNYDAYLINFILIA